MPTSQETPKNDDSIKSLKTTVTVEVSLPGVGTAIRRDVPLSEADAARLRDHLLDRGMCAATFDPTVPELGCGSAVFIEDLAGISPDRLRPATLGEGPRIPLDGTLREVIGPAITNARAAAKINFTGRAVINKEGIDKLPAEGFQNLAGGIARMEVEEGRPRKLPEPTPPPAGPRVVIAGPGYRAVEPPNIVRTGLGESPQIPRTPNDAWPQPPSDWLEDLKKEVTGWFEASADASPHGVVADRVTCVVRRKLGFKDYKDRTELEQKVAAAFSVGLSRL